MQYFNPALLHKQADGREETMRKIKESGERIRRKFEQTDPQQNDSQQNNSQQNDQFKPFDQLSDNYDMSAAIDDVSNWWGGQGDKASAAGNRALTYFTPRLVGSLGLAAVVSLLAGRKGGIMPALIGAVAGWFLGGPAMNFFQKTFGSKPEDVTKRAEDAKKENGTNGTNGAGTNGTNGTNGTGAKNPVVEKPNEGNNGQQPQEPTDEEELIREQGGEIPTTGGNPVEDPGAYGLPEEDPDGEVLKLPAAGQHPQQPEQPQQLTEEEELIREERQRKWEQQQEQELEQLIEETQGEWGLPQQPPQPAPAPAPVNNGQPVVEQPAEDPQGSIPPEPIPPEPIPSEPIPVAPEQPAEDPTTGGAPNMMGQIKGKVEAAAGGMKQAGGKLLDRIRDNQQPTPRPQNPTEARAQAQQRPQQPQQPQSQQTTQQPQMTAKEWQQQVQDRMRGPWSIQQSPEMQFHEYAYNIPEKTAPSHSYLGLGRTPSQEALTQAYPDDMVKEHAMSNPFNQRKSPAELRQEMYYNDQRGLMHGRRPQGRPLQTDVPAGKFTLKRDAVYNDLLRQHRGQPKVGPYKQR